MSLIAFGKIQKKLYLIIIITVEIIIYLYGMKEGMDYYNVIFYVFAEELGPLIIGIILFFIFKPKKDKKSKKRYRELIILFVLKAIKCCYDCLYTYYIQDPVYDYGTLSNTVNGVEIFLISIVTYFLLKYKYYIHHIISMILYLLLGIGNDLILDSYSMLKFDYLYIYIIYIINEIFLFCFFKYMMDELYYHYTELLILYGIFGLVIKIFIYLLLIRNEYKTENFLIINILQYNFQEIDVIHIIFYQCLFFITERGVYFLLILLVSFYLSPNHNIITENISAYLAIFIFEENTNKYYSIITFVLQLFILLFYFEILEFNFLCMNKNTLKNIRMREIIDRKGRNSFVSEIELEDQYVIKNNERKSRDSDDEDDKNDNCEIEKEDLLVNGDTLNKNDELGLRIN